MKRKLCLILVIILMMALCACGKKAEAPAEPEITAGPDESVDMANPWHDITEAEAKELCPKSFIAGNSFTAREQITGDPDADISGMYYDWTHQMDVTLRNWADITCRTYRWIGEEGYADLCSWYDTESETSYSVSVTASDLDGFDLCAIAEALHG